MTANSGNDMTMMAASMHVALLSIDEFQKSGAMKLFIRRQKIV